MKYTTVSAAVAAMLSLNLFVGDAGAAAAATTAAATAPGMRAAKHPAHVEFTVKPGNRRTIYEADLFVPLFQDYDRMFFADIRGMRDSKKNKEGNFGLGYRHIANNKVMLGAYAFYDARRTRLKHSFHGATIGVEAIGHVMEGRANVYLPTNKQYALDRATGPGIVGHTIGIVANEAKRYEKAQRGFDAEIGARVPTAGVASNLEARFFIGGYRFARSGTQTISGPRVRAELAYRDVIPALPGSRLTLGVEVMRDKRNTKYDMVARKPKNQTHVYGNIGLRIPLHFGGKICMPEGLQYELARKVIRDVDIVSSATNPQALSKPEIVAAYKGGKAYVANSTDGDDTNGDGTAEKPFKTATKALAAATAEGDVVFVEGVKRTDKTAAAANYGDANMGFVENNQYFLASGAEFKLPVTYTGTGAKANTNVVEVSKTAPKFSGGAGHVFNLTDTTTTLSGFDAETTGANSVVNAAHTAGASNITIVNVKATGSANTAAAFNIGTTAASTGTTTLTDVTATGYNGAAGAGVKISAAGTSTNTVTATNVSATGNTLGMDVDTTGTTSKVNLTLDGGALDKNTNGGLDANLAGAGGSITLTATDTSFSENTLGTGTGHGVNVTSAANTAGTITTKLTGVTAQKNAVKGVFISPDTQAALVTSTTIAGDSNLSNNVGGEGFGFKGANTTGGAAAHTISITDSTISGNTAAGGVLINPGFADGALTVTIQGNDIKDNVTGVANRTNVTGQIAIIAAQQAAAASTYNIIDNTLTSPGNGIAVATFAGVQAANVTLTDNTITVAGTGAGVTGITGANAGSVTAFTLTGVNKISGGAYGLTGTPGAGSTVSYVLPASSSSAVITGTTAGLGWNVATNGGLKVAHTGVAVAAYGGAPADLKTGGTGNGLFNNILQEP